MCTANLAPTATAPFGWRVPDKRQGGKLVAYGHTIDDEEKRVAKCRSTVAARTEEEQVLRPRPHPTARVGKVDASNASPRRRLASRGACRAEPSLRGGPGGPGP